LTDLIGITIHAWRRDAQRGRSVGRSVGRAIGKIGNWFCIAKIANAVSSLAILAIGFE
jgi:hypothetical protein